MDCPRLQSLGARIQTHLKERVFLIVLLWQRPRGIECMRFGARDREAVNQTTESSEWEASELEHPCVSLGLF